MSKNSASVPDLLKLAGDKVSDRRQSSRRGLPTYKENPFWRPYEVKVGKKYIKVAGGYHVSEETGETIQHSGIHIIEEKDEDEFVKLYTKNMKIFFDLKPSTQKVLMAVLDAVQKVPGTDRIYLNWFEVESYSDMHALKVSRASFHNAMRELLTKGFVAESENPNMYWINPHLFFNGDRMIFIREYRRAKQQAISQETTGNPTAKSR